MECPSIATRVKLPEHPSIKAELCFDHEVQQVVRHKRVVARSGIHHDFR
jgi:hypothetical protein